MKFRFDLPPEKPFTINLASRRAVLTFLSSHIAASTSSRFRPLMRFEKKNGKSMMWKIASDNLLQSTDDCIFRCFACEQSSSFYHSILYYSHPQSDSTIASRVQYNNALRRDNVLGVGDPAGHRWSIRRFVDLSKGKSKS